MKKLSKEHRDWRLLVLILFLGIFLMCIAGQIAVRLSPSWSIRASMDSSLKPGSASRQEAGFLPPILPDILTPLGWLDTFLTPHPGSGTGGVPAAPFMVLEPTSTPFPSEPPPTSQVTETSTPPAPTNTPATATATATKDPNRDGGGGGNPPPTTTSQPPPSPPPPVVSNNPNPPSGLLTNPPAGFNSGAPDGNGGSIHNNLLDGQYFVINSPVHVAPTPDGHYDMVYYEMANPTNCGGQVCMDHVIIGITNDATGQTYYEVFNWGDGIRDTNTNVDTNNLPPDNVNCPSGGECDNRIIPTSDLYQDPSSPPPPPDLQTGVLIDVDTAPSNPPRDPVTGTTYDYVVVVAPPASSPNNAGDDMNLDSVQVTEVASPTPP